VRCPQSGRRAHRVRAAAAAGKRARGDACGLQFAQALQACQAGFAHEHMFRAFQLQPFVAHPYDRHPTALCAPSPGRAMHCPEHGAASASKGCLLHSLIQLARCTACWPFPAHPKTCAQAVVEQRHLPLFWARIAECARTLEAARRTGCDAARPLPHAAVDQVGRLLHAALKVRPRLGHALSLACSLLAAGQGVLHHGAWGLPRALLPKQQLTLKGIPRMSGRYS